MSIAGLPIQLYTIGLMNIGLKHFEVLCCTVKETITMWMFRKGQVLKNFLNDSVVLVLNNGLPGKKFVEKYRHEDIQIANESGRIGYWTVNRDYIYYLHPFETLGYREERIWFNVMIGDINCWATTRTLIAWTWEPGRGKYSGQG